MFWITSKSNQKYRLDVVSEVFNRSGRAQDKTQRGVMACELNLFLTSMPLYMVPESFVCPWGSPNDQIMYRKQHDRHRMHSFSTYSQEQHNQRALYHLCSFVFIMRKLNLTNSFKINAFTYAMFKMIHIHKIQFAKKWICVIKRLF